VCWSWSALECIAVYAVFLRSLQATVFNVTAFFQLRVNTGHNLKQVSIFQNKSALWFLFATDLPQIKCKFPLVIFFGRAAL